MPRSMFSGIALACAIAFSLPAMSQARYTGPSVLDERPTVQDILDKPQDGQPVRLQGKLLRQTGRQYYVFSDGTAEIKVEIDEDDFPQTPVNENTVVEIRGEVDTGLKRAPEIEVEELIIVE